MVGRFGRQLMAAALMALAVLAASPADAQTPRPSETVSASPDIKTARTRLDSFKAELDQTERALQARELPDPELQRLRSQIDPVAEAIRALIDDLAPRLDTTRARLEQLGPKPRTASPRRAPTPPRNAPSARRPSPNLDETQR
jgi:small-conductance mechanosensitive channel